MFKYFKYFDKDSVGVGLTYEDTWRPDENLVIKRIHITRKDGAAFTKSTFFFKVADVVYTHPQVLCKNLGPDILTSPVLDIPISAGQTFAFIFKNLETAAVDVVIQLELWSA